MSKMDFSKTSRLTECKMRLFSSRLKMMRFFKLLHFVLVVSFESFLFQYVPYLGSTYHLMCCCPFLLVGTTNTTIAREYLQFLVTCRLETHFLFSEASTLACKPHTSNRSDAEVEEDDS